MNTKPLTSPRRGVFDFTEMITLRPLAKTVQGCRPNPGPALSYALDRLFLIADNTAPTSSVLSFQSATAVANYFGVTSQEASLANEYFADDNGAPATMLISRYGFGGARPHLYGANISNLTLNQLQSISGSLSIDFDGYTYSGSINLSGESFSGAASAIQTALNQNRPVAATTTGSSIAPVSVSFTGSVNGLLLQVTSVSSGSIELGAQISGPGIAAGAQIVNQWDGTPGGPGLYVLFAPGGTTSSETMTESYGVLTVGSVTSGTVAVGQEVTGAGVASLTAIDGNLSGSGAGSTWLVNNAQTVAGENMTMTAHSPHRHLQLYRWRDRKSRLFRGSAKRRLRLRSQSIVLELHGRHGRGRVGSDASVGSPQFDAGWAIRRRPPRS